ncbi:hypothetical protein CEXT_469861 [Caerostris extrusa]|uniref:LAGLIDADG homing endonuclease n=1 Tax=Caerostris extrusa TaxID=172846 RepID=A0AAV4R3V9_CAEEX|nr:hypothetical protein CEXT_469861 [Caerostris extrusa]
MSAPRCGGWVLGETGKGHSIMLSWVLKFEVEKFSNYRPTAGNSNIYQVEGKRRRKEKVTTALKDGLQGTEIINASFFVFLWSKNGHNHQAHEKAILSYLITFSMETGNYYLGHDAKPFVDSPSTRLWTYCPCRFHSDNLLSEIGLRNGCSLERG